MYSLKNHFFFFFKVLRSCCVYYFKLKAKQKQNTCSQSLNCHPGSLHGSNLGPLHICYSCIVCCSYGTPNSGGRVSLILPALGNLSPLDMRVCL